MTAAAAEAAECARSGLSGRAWRADQNTRLLEYRHMEVEWRQRVEREAAERRALCNCSDYESDSDGY